nr:hypothetical protein [Arthrobacter sp. CDRTa11]
MSTSGVPPVYWIAPPANSTSRWAAACGDGLALFQRYGLVEPVAVGGAHVVHAHRGDGLDPGIDLRRADHKAAAAADPDGPHALLVNEGLRAQVVHRGAEVFGIDVGRDGVARLAGAFSPEGEVEGERDVALLGHFGGVEVGALFLHGAHGVAHHQRRRLRQSA